MFVLAGDQGGSLFATFFDNSSHPNRCVQDSFIFFWSSLLSFFRSAINLRHHLVDHKSVGSAQIAEALAIGKTLAEAFVSKHIRWWLRFRWHGAFLFNSLVEESALNNIGDVFLVWKDFGLRLIHFGRYVDKFGRTCFLWAFILRFRGPRVASERACARRSLVL